MNTVATTRPSANALAALNTLRAGLQNVQQTLVVKGGDPYLRLLTDGDWVYGQENIEVEQGSLWAVNPMSLRHGWVAWESGKNADTTKGPRDELMVACTQPLPDKASLRDVTQGLTAGVSCDWEPQYSFSLVCLTGEDKGTQVLYKTANAGGTRAIDTLIKAIERQLDQSDEIVPAIQLLTDSYDNKRYRKEVFYPIFKIEQWLPLTDNLPDLEDATDGEAKTEAAAPAAAPPAPEPAKRTRRASVPATGNAAPAASQPAAAAPTKSVDEMTEEELMEYIAAKKAAKDAQTVPVDPAAARRAALQAELAALDGPAMHTAQPAMQAAPAAAPAAGQTLRRRRG